MEDSKYSLSSESINYTGTDKKAVISGKYTIQTLDNSMTFKGKDAEYNQASGDFVSKGDILVQGKDYTAKGKDITYNTNTGLGRLDSQIEIENPKEKLKLRGDKFSFKNGEYLAIDENIYIEGENIIANSQRAKYNLKDKNIYSRKNRFPKKRWRDKRNNE